MKEFLSIYILAILLVSRARVHSIPLDTAAAVETGAAAKNVTNVDESGSSNQAAEETTVGQSTDLAVGARENINAGALGSDQTPPGSYEQGVYSGLNPTDAFQQYYNKFNAAYSPFYPSIPAPFPAAYPAPAGYGSQLPYNAPYVVQTDYDGYLMPTSNIETAATTATTEPLAYLRNLVAGLMATTIFRVLAAILSTIGVVFFGGAIATAICSFTPICDISFKAVTYLRRHDSAERVAKTIVEEIASERVRRATELVWKAIRKYGELQQTSGE